MQISQPQSEKELGNQAANNEIGLMMAAQSSRQVVDNFNNPGHKSQEYFCVIKLGKASMISNLVGLVIIFFYLMIYYAIISVNWKAYLTISTILCIIADVLLLMQISIFFYSIINKSRLMNLSISLNFVSILLKILAVIVLARYLCTMKKQIIGE